VSEQQHDGRKLRGEKTRRAILMAAIQVLSEHGKAGFSARTVAEQAGISKAALFHHFANMDEIIRSLFFVIMSESDSEPRIEAGQNLKQYIETRLTRMVDFMERYGGTVSGYMHVVEIMRSHPVMGPELQSVLKEYQEEIAKHISALAGPDGDATRIRRALDTLAAILEGIGVLLAYYNEPDDFRDAIPDVARMFAKYIRGEI